MDQRQPQRWAITGMMCRVKVTTGCFRVMLAFRSEGLAGVGFSVTGAIWRLAL